jgi:uncharacterized protein YbbC (DUF1343 family)/CubicO group peptidase (beta-lactamase class C family)
MMPRYFLLLPLALLPLAGCQRPLAPSNTPVPVAPLPRVRTVDEVFHANKLAEMDQAITNAVAAKRCPGGVLWVEREGVAYTAAFGQRAVVPAPEPMTGDTIFDLASLTKVVAGTPAVMVLVERGQVSLEAPVAKYLPEFTGGGKENVTIRQLLTHTSGLRPDIGLKPDWSGWEECIRLCCAEKLSAKPDEKIIYSDTGLILAGEIVRRVSGKPLDVFVQESLYVPLGMKDTGFNPPKEKLPRIAPTEVENGVPVRGVVHDPRARRTGGVAGHAGLFSTASDLARFSRMMLNLGELDGARVFKPETVRLMTSVQTPSGMNGRRGLGWDMDTGYSGPRGKWFPLGSYGHTGWTGTSLWIDPFSQSFVIFLSNRNHPTEDGGVVALRAQLGTLAAEAVKEFNFLSVPGALPPRAGAASTPSTPPRTILATLNGIDVLKRDKFAPLRGLKLGLVTNHTGRDRERNATIDLLMTAPDVQLKVLFSPEHGIRGLLDEKVSDSVDEKTGLPVFSLYGEVRKPKPEQLAGLDALVYDIQDIGCRFYTYTSTMGNCLQACGEQGLKFFVLDRVDPINGVTLDGPVAAAESSFVSYHPIPVRYGMTIGELALMFKAERNWPTDLTVIKAENWSRGAWFDQTGLPWVNPSPNMRSLTQAALYPGVGLLEFCAVSVGRGTDTPFEVLGAPYISAERLATELSRAGLPGVSFVPVRFKPNASKFKDQECGGVNIVLLDRDTCRVVDVALLMATTLHRLYPKEFDLPKMERLLTHPATLEAIRAGRTITQIRQLWGDDLTKFEARREKFLLYR